MKVPEVFKISGNQVFWMMASMDVGMSILLTITPSIAASRRDAWISSIIAGGITIFATIVATKLGVLYPKQTLIEFSQTILGKWLGRLIVIPYFVQWYSVIGLILRQFADLVSVYILPLTPTIIIILIMSSLIVYAAYQGVEVIGRCSEIIGPLIIFIIAITISISLGDAKWDNLLPLFVDTGWPKILKGSLPTASFLGQSVMMMMLVKFMSKPKEGPLKATFGAGIASLFVTLVTTVIILNFGQNAPSRMWYPYFELTRSIVPLLEVFIIIIWFFSVFMRLSLYLFIATYGTAQLFSIDNWQKLFWFTIPATVVIALWPKSIIESSIIYPEKFVVPFVLPLLIIAIPLALLVIEIVKKKIV